MAWPVGSCSPSGTDSTVLGVDAPRSQGDVDDECGPRVLNAAGSHVLVSNHHDLCYRPKVHWQASEGSTPRPHVDGHVQLCYSHQNLTHIARLSPGNRRSGQGKVAQRRRGCLERRDKRHRYWQVVVVVNVVQQLMDLVRCQVNHKVVRQPRPDVAGASGVQPQ